ncbi:hypothetical protein [Gracilibacillus sp. JCM 18860]|uniref:hypothetical protein n=1 Tax=Gracilibacillus sp. JCM 18860 TaxID=1306159 RepID=UPI000B2685A1
MEPFIYLYAFIPEEEVESKPLANMEGFDRQNNIYTVTIDGIKAVVCRSIVRNILKKSSKKK